MHALFSFQHASTCITNCCVPRVGLAVGLAGRLGRSAWQVGLAGPPGRPAWQVSLAGRLGRSAWQVGLAGRLGRLAWQVGRAGRAGLAGGLGRSAWQVGLAGLGLGGRLGRSARQVGSPIPALGGELLVPENGAIFGSRFGNQNHVQRASFWYPQMGSYLVPVLGTISGAVINFLIVAPLLVPKSGTKK